MVSLKFRTALLSVAGTVLFCGVLRAQDEAPLKLNVTSVDSAAAEHASNAVRHAKPANTPQARAARRENLLTKRSESFKSKKDDDDSRKSLVRYEGDLSYEGGPVVDFAKSHPIYLLPHGKCPIATCWGDPAGFLKSLGHSEFIHLIDQYIGVFDGGRYTLGVSLDAIYTPPKKPLVDADMQAIVHGAAALTGLSGYGHIYHVFLPPGQDECFDSTFSTCYSPDNPASFFFCAYHGSVDFPDVGHVLYTVEPYQNVPGCSLLPGTPNGQLIDSTNSVLAHETFETITDPDINAWRNLTSSALFLAEIADECEFVTFVGTNTYFDPFVYEIHEKPYATQPMYSNAVHGCAVQ